MTKRELIALCDRMMLERPASSHFVDHHYWMSVKDQIRQDGMTVRRAIENAVHAELDVYREMLDECANEAYELTK